MMINIALVVGSPIGLLAQPPAPAGNVATASLVEFSRDLTVFDSGAHLGLNAAQVPLSGTTDANDGSVIQARAVSVDDGGTTSTGWQDIATASGNSWTGTISVPRSPSWYRAEVRVRNSSAAPARMISRFGAGHVWALFEQSNWHRVFESGFNNTAPDPLVSDDDVQIFTRASSVVTRTVLSDASPLSAATVAFANAFLANRPGEKLALAAHVQPGTSAPEMADDSNLARNWSDAAALHSAVTADGSPVGLVTSSWVAWEASDQNPVAMVPIITGQMLDGSPVAPGGTVTFGNKSFALDHNMSELYDWSYSRYALIGPHGRGLSITAAGYAAPEDADYHDLVDAWKDLSNNANFGLFLPHSFEMHGALRGYPYSANPGLHDPAGTNWADVSHHNSHDKDGLERLASMGTLAILKSAGLVSWDVPQFDQVYYDPSGAYADFWMAGQDITTLRSLRGGSSSYVRGWTLNGAPLTTEAQLVGNAGESGHAGVRITPATPLTYSDNIQYGLGRLPGFQNFPDDYLNRYHLDLPVADTGQGGLDALPVTPRSTAALANTLPAPMNFTTAASGPFFLKPNSIGTNPTALRFELVASFTDKGSAQACFDAGGPNLQVRVLSNGKVRLSSASGMTFTTPTAVISWDQQVTITTTLVQNGPDMGLNLEVDGAVALSATVPNQTIRGGYVLSLLALQNGSSQVVGTIESIDYWLNDVAGSGAPSMHISGSAPSVNTHPWKQGSDAS